MESLSDNLHSIRLQIENAAQKAGRISDEITLIAVSKTKPNELIKKVLENNQFHFGENRMQELQTKMNSIEDSRIQWHMIGTMQTNKIRHIAHRVNWIHSVGKAKYLNEIDKRAKAFDRKINVLIQVNISGEDQKSGCNPSEIEPFIETARQYQNIEIRGFMGMARFTSNPEDVRTEFAKLRAALEKNHHLNDGNIQLKELSMGMSNDFEVAIEEGATMVRIGSSIFGARN